MAAKSAEQAEAEEKILAHVRHEMATRGITAEELARRLGTDSGNMSRIMNGERGIGLGMAIRLSRVLQVNLTRLCGEWPSTNT